jgi:heptosyltransferase-2
VKPRLLVIRGGAIGDFILTLPALGLLRENFPEAHLEIIGYRHIVALAEGRYYADATRSIEYGPMASFFSPKTELPADLAEYFAEFQQIVSYLYDPDGFFEGNLRRAGAKNVLSAWRKLDDSDHATRQLAQPLQQLALYLENPAARFHPAAGDLAAAAALLSAAGMGPLIALHPGSGSPKKNWPVASWVELGRRLAAHPSSPTLLVTGGEADEATLATLEQAWAGLPIVWLRDLPLPTLGAVLGQCRQFIGHDSGISHLAAAAGANCTLLFGPTDPDVWAPLNEGVRVLPAPDGKLEELSVDRAWECISAAAFA